jgi:glucose dehydrogenase
MSTLSKASRIAAPIFLAALSLALSACNKQSAEPTAQTPAATPPANAPPAAKVDTDAEFQANVAKPENWGGIGRDFALTRHSPLADVNKDNVKGLKMSWEMKSGATRGHEGQPLG